MNYFNETEKSLKRYLKSKVSITMATVVGFLIAGTISFGADGTWVDAPTSTGTINVSVDNNIGSYGQWEVSVVGGSTTTGSSDWYGQGLSEDVLTKNESTVTFEKGNNLVLDSSVNKSENTPAVGAAINGVTKAENNGNIWVTGTGYGEALQGSWGVKTEVVNNGNIYVDGALSAGIGVNPGVTAVNVGDIYVKEGSGIKVNGGTVDKTVDNKGNIYVDGDNAIGINYYNIGVAENESVTNSGLIQVGKGIGVNLTGGAGKTFVNAESGTIKVVGEGTGVNVEWGQTFVNNGTVDGGENGQGILINVNNPQETSTIKVENNGEIYGTVGITEEGTNSEIAKTSTVVVENNKNIETTSKGISWDGYYTKYSSFEVTNNGNIVVEGDNATQGIYVASRPDAGKGVIKNNGNITVNNTDTALENPYHTAIVGIRVHENTEGYNGENGVITVSGNGAAGVAVTGGAIETNQVTDTNKVKYTYFENDGTINVSGKESVGLLVRHDDTNPSSGDTAEVSVAAVNNGTIKASGEGAVGVKLSHYELENTTEKLVNLQFTNNGTIEATGEDSKAIYSEIDDLTVNLVGNSHIVGVVDLTGAKNNTLDINGVGLDEQETITINGDNDKLVINNSDVVIEGTLTNEEGTAISVNNKDGNNTVVNNATIVAETGIGVMDEGSDNSQAASDRLVSITNNGDITAEHYGIYNNGYYTKYNKININNTGNILVNGFAKDEKTYDKPYYYATGIYQAAGPYTTTAGVVRNSEQVRVELTEAQYNELKARYEETQGEMYLNIHGVRIHEHSEGYNTGDIIVNAFGGNGVVLSAGDTGANAVEEFKDRYNYFENKGNISVKGENGIGLVLKNTTTAKVEAINDSTGVITVNGDNAIAVKVNGANAEFTNKGMLVLGEEGTNKKAIVVENGGQATNNGIVQVLGAELDGVSSKEEALDKLFTGELKENLGLIVDKDGNALFAGSEETTVTEDTTTDVLESLSGIDGSLTLEGDITLSAGNLNPEVTTDVLNVIKGTTTIASENEVNIEAGTINLDAKGQLAVSKDATLGLDNGTLNKVVGTEEDKVAINNEGILNLTNMDINGDITNNGTMNVEAGESSFDGAITGDGKLVIEKNGILNFSSSSSMKKPETRARITVFADTPNLTINGTANVEIGSKVEDGVYVENFFANSNGLVVDGNGKLALDTSAINGEAAKVSLGKDNSFTEFKGDVTTTSGDNGIYKVDETGIGKDNIVNITYNKELYKDTNTIINNMNKEAYAVNNFFSQDVATREKQLDTLYANNIYSETARAAYDMMKLNEESVLSLNADAKVGEWVAAGKALYNKTEYDRTGTVGEYSAETETSGLMAGLEYGVNETTSVGVAFSGAYQDIDTKGGSADGNVFYLGTYAKKQIGKLSLIAGLGYQYGDYDADNTAASVSSSASYDVNAYSAYVEGRYGVDLGDNVTLEPKLKLGYTYVDQDNVSDDYFRLSDSELSTFDAEVGADLVKTVALKSGKLDVRFGASYVRAFGDTDDKFTGSFAGSTGSFDVLGAELSEDTAKFDLGVEVSKDNGVFYNLGGTLRVGSDNTRDYGVKLGAGYKF